MVLSQKFTSRKFLHAVPKRLPVEMSVAWCQMGGVDTKTLNVYVDLSVHHWRQRIPMCSVLLAPTSSNFPVSIWRALRRVVARMSLGWRVLERVCPHARSRQLTASTKRADKGGGPGGRPLPPRNSGKSRRCKRHGFDPACRRRHGGTTSPSPPLGWTLDPPLGSAA